MKLKRLTETRNLCLNKLGEELKKVMPDKAKHIDESIKDATSKPITLKSMIEETRKINNE